MAKPVCSSKWSRSRRAGKCQKHQTEAASCFPVRLLPLITYFGPHLCLPFPVYMPRDQLLGHRISSRTTTLHPRYAPLRPASQLAVLAVPKPPSRSHIMLRINYFICLPSTQQIFLRAWPRNLDLKITSLSSMIQIDKARCLCIDQTPRRQAEPQAPTWLREAISKR
jgi:hypothetical protein